MLVMKKIIFYLLSAAISIFIILLAASAVRNYLAVGKIINWGYPKIEKSDQAKQEILRFAIVTDSENDNENLGMVLGQAKAGNAKFVIGLGDFTKLGMIEDLNSAKNTFDRSGLLYFVTAGDRDMWSSRNEGMEATTIFRQVFGAPTSEFNQSEIQFILVSDADIYKGISPGDWSLVSSSLLRPSNLTFVFAHKTPYHPQSSHVMGADDREVADQAKEFMTLMEQTGVDGFFSGDLHFFAQFSSKGGSTSGRQSPEDVVKITTIGAVGRERNILGSRFAMVRVYSDYTWEVEDMPI